MTIHRIEQRYNTAVSGVEAARHEAEKAVKSFQPDAELGGPDYGGYSLHVRSKDGRQVFNRPIQHARSTMRKQGAASVVPRTVLTTPDNQHAARTIAQPIPKPEKKAAPGIRHFKYPLTSVSFGRARRALAVPRLRRHDGRALLR